MLSGERHFKNTFFFKLLLSFLAFSFFIIVALSLIFSKISVDSAYKQVSSEYVNSLKQGSNAVENTLEEIRQVYTVLNTDKDVYEFLNTLKSDPYVNIRAENKGRQLRQINSYINSIYIYNNSIKELINIGARYFNPEESPEGVLLTDSDIKAGSFLIPRKTEVESRAQTESKALITMAFHETFSDGVKLRNSIVINLDEDIIQKNLVESQGSTVIAADANGRIFLHTDPGQVAGNIGKEPYLEKILKDKAASGSFITEIDRLPNMVTFYRNENLGWYFISIRPYKNIAGAIGQKRNQVIVFSLVILMVFSLAGFIVSRKLYSPIRVISNTVKDYNEQAHNPSAGKSGNEIMLIMEAFKNSLNQIKSLELKNMENTSILKEDFLRKLLKNENIAETDAESIHGMDIGVSFDNLITVAVKIDGYNNAGPEKKELFEAAAGTLIRKALERDFCCEVVSMYGGEFAVLLTYRNNEANSFNMLLDRLKEAADIISNSLGISITAGIGGVSDSMGQCGAVYEKALNLVKYRFILGYGNVIHDKLVEDNLVSSVNYPGEIEEKLVRAMRINRKAEFEGHLDDLILILKNYKYSDAVLILFQLILACVKALNHIAGSQKRIHMDFDEFNRMFLEMQTIEQVKGQIMKIYEEYQSISEDLNRMKGDKYYKVIENIKNYIGANYNNTALSADMLAELSGYTTNYFTRIFKEVTGVYIIDYIRQVRINKAKELLKDSSLKISDISDMAGFINTSHFYSAFKKEVGLTPSSFRSLITGGGSE